MAKYFANGNSLRPPKWEDEGAEKEAVVGVLDSFFVRPKRNSDGKWFIVRIASDAEFTDVYFENPGIGYNPHRYLDSLVGRQVRVCSDRGLPVLEAVGVKSEGDIRELLLKGVLEGRIDREDMPALVQFAKGDDSGFERWRLFKEESRGEELSSVKDRILRRQEAIVSEIDALKMSFKRLQVLYDEVSDERIRLIKELEADLLLLNGDAGLGGILPMPSEHLVLVDGGYRVLIEAMEKFRTRKGIYVLCDDKVHLIEYAYFDDQNRAFLIGKSREYLRAQPEKMKSLISGLQDAIRGVKR